MSASLATSWPKNLDCHEVTAFQTFVAVDDGALVGDRVHLPRRAPQRLEAHAGLLVVDHQGRDAGQVADERHVDQVDEDAGAQVLVGVAGGVTVAGGEVGGRRIGSRIRGLAAVGAAAGREIGEAGLEVADLVEVLLEADLVVLADAAHQRVAAFLDEIEHAELARERGLGGEVRPGVAGIEVREQRLVGELRAGLGDSRRAVGLVRHARSGARVAVAVSLRLRPELERPVVRLVSVGVRDELVRTRAVRLSVVVVGRAIPGQQRHHDVAVMRVGLPARRRHPARPGPLDRKPGHDRNVLAHRLELRKPIRHRVPRPNPRRLAVQLLNPRKRGHIPTRSPIRRPSRPRQHRLQKRQRHRHPPAPAKNARRGIRSDLPPIAHT